MDFETTNGLFNSEGRMIQVEYAQNVSSQSSTIIIQKSGTKVSIAYENRQTNGLDIPMDKILVVDPERHIYLIFSGLKPDSSLVAAEANYICRSYKYTTGEDIPMSVLARRIGEFKQKYTVDQSFRPLGLRTVLFTAENDDPRVFVIETDGNYSEYTCYCLGHKSDIVNSYMEQSGADGNIFKGLLQIMQKDGSKIKAFELTATGLSMIPEDQIKAEFDN